MGADNAVFEAVIDNRHGRGILDRVKLALLHDGIANAFIVFQTDGFDPSHVRMNLIFGIRDGIIVQNRAKDCVFSRSKWQRRVWETLRDRAAR